MTRAEREEAAYQEATGLHFNHFARVFETVRERAKVAAQKAQERDRVLRRIRSGLVERALVPRMATELFRRRDVWPIEYSVRWLRELGVEAYWIGEIRLAFEQRLYRFALENPNVIALPPRRRKKG